MARPELSQRELQVLHGMASGRSNKEIAQILFISESTVKDHVKSVFGKLDAMGRTEAITIATKRGLIRTGQVPAPDRDVQWNRHIKALPNHCETKLCARDEKA